MRFAFALAVLADRPDAFDSGDVGTLLGVAIDVVNALRRVPCRKFRPGT